MKNKVFFFSFHYMLKDCHRIIKQESDAWNCHQFSNICCVKTHFHCQFLNAKTPISLFFQTDRDMWTFESTVTYSASFHLSSLKCIHLFYNCNCTLCMWLHRLTQQIMNWECFPEVYLFHQEFDYLH